MPVFRETPYAAYNFLVSIGDADPGTAAAGFTEVSGLDQELEVLQYRAGNDKTSAPRLIPGLPSAITVACTRGVIGDVSLQEWINSALSGSVERKQVTIQLLAEDRNAVQRWELQNAIPVKLLGPTLHASVSAIAVEELVFVAERMQVT
jgi:phage tail-like protein